MGKLWDRFWGLEETVEVRESAYTDTLVSLLTSRAAGKTIKATATGALEAAAGVVGRAFALAEVSGPPPLVDAFGPDIRGMVGRGLIREGEVVTVVDLVADSLVLRPGASWDIEGGYDPEGWRYSVLLGGPSGTVTRHTPAPRVLHFRFATDPDRPWKGIGPIESATLAGRLSAEVVAALGDEVSMVRGALLPIPLDPEDESVATLKDDLKKLAGQLAMVESQTTGEWRAQRQTAPRDGGWTPQRIGANPPEPLVTLADQAAKEVLMACGLSPALFGGGDATSAREAWRLALHGLIAPLGDLVAHEIATKTGEAITMSFDRLRASDVQGRARAFQSLTGGGMEVGSAAAFTGFDGAEAVEVEPLGR